MKVVFVLASDDNTNNIKRIEEFIEHGYDVEVYSFKRRETLNKSNSIRFDIIGNFSNDLPYYKRILIMIKGVKTVLNKTRKTNCIYYLIRNDVALYFTLLSRRPYIFEEADMSHLSMSNHFLSVLIEKRIKRIIKNSIVSVFRSEGFVQYHFEGNPPKNVFVIPNRLHKSVLDIPPCSYKSIDICNLKFGFVGGIRYESVFAFAKILLEYFPQHEFHFYGDFVSPKTELFFKPLKKYKNCFFHGKFKSPDDLPQIYSQIDLLLSTYDAYDINVRYAEPNKLYESIFFNTPIIVSSNTFLSDKVRRLGIGYDINVFDKNKVLSFLNNLTIDSITDKINNTKKIPPKDCISINDSFFDMLSNLL